MNPLNTVKWPLIIGFVLAVAIAALVEGGLTFNSITLAALTRWLHIIAGVFWIGLLYYFNAVQTPAMAVAAAFGAGNFRLGQTPFFIGQVAGIAKLAPIISAAVLVRPHRRHPANRAVAIESQVTPMTQDVVGQMGWTAPAASVCHDSGCQNLQQGSRPR